MYNITNKTQESPSMDAGAAVGEKPREVHAAMRMLDGQVSVATEMLDALASQLTPVAAPRPFGQSEDKLAEFQSPLANQIEGQAMRVNHLVKCIRYILDSVQV